METKQLTIWRETFETTFNEINIFKKFEWTLNVCYNTETYSLIEYTPL